MIRGTWAVIPARSFPSAKSRLTAGLATDRSRAEIARALFDRAIATATRAASIDGVLVATDGDDVAAAARDHGATVLLDVQPAPFAAVIDRSLATLAARGAAAAVVIMADLPLLGPRHVDDLATALDDADLVLAPDRDQLGTNAIAVRLPALLATRFGHRDSFGRHLTAAAAANLRVAVVRAHGLAFDLDLPADLDELLAAVPTPEPEPLVAGQRVVGAKGRRRIADTVQRIAAAVRGASAVRGADDPIQRRPLRPDPTGAARDLA